MERNKNIIGLEKLSRISESLGISIIGIKESKIPDELLKKYQSDPEAYILIHGVDKFCDNTPLTLCKWRKFFGLSNIGSEPCFYNQDWYISEEFANNSYMQNKWYLLKKEVINDSRGILPTFDDEDVLKKLPSALLCAFTFFSYYLLNNELLWKHDFVWCNDKDHNGDQIYVGKYVDPEGVNNDGFEIHRHLRINKNYGVITFY